MSVYVKLEEVRSKIGKLTKDTANPFFKSKYADINQLIEMTDPILRDHGLLCLQPIIRGFVTTQIIKVDTGEMVTSELEIPASITDPQKIGGCVTYYRRYTLKSLLNIQEEDDDANRAYGNTTPPQQDDNRPWLSEDQFNKILARINKGEKLFEQTKANFRMKKAYSETIKSAEDKQNGG